MELEAGLNYAYQNADSTHNAQQSELHITLDPQYVQTYQTERNLFCAKYKNICNSKSPDSIKYSKYELELDKLTLQLREVLEKNYQKNKKDKNNKQHLVTITLKGDFDNSLQNLIIKLNGVQVPFNCNYPKHEALFTSKKGRLTIERDNKIIKDILIDSSITISILN